MWVSKSNPIALQLCTIAASLTEGLGGQPEAGRSAQQPDSEVPNACGLVTPFLKPIFFS